MKEIGGFIELDTYMLPMLHEDAIKLNSARNCLLFLIRIRKIKKILLPKFLCDSVMEVCKKENVEIRYYSINYEFIPQNIALSEDEWFYFVNYYGQISNEFITKLKEKYDRIIVDNVQAFYQKPVSNVDTIYTCRKFFGVPDGAFLYANIDDMGINYLNSISQDVSNIRMSHLLGRFEGTANQYYSEYVKAEHDYKDMPLRKMSKLTYNLLHGIDYLDIKERRKRNYEIIHREFSGINKLDLLIPEGAFMYPLYIVNGYEIREKLQKRKIYIPTLWPDVFEICTKDEVEYEYANNILPLPVDQRYNENDMNYIINEVSKCIC
ncbi:MAG: hypothetical protein IKL22_09145 [Lachnospiraceae bacterium]|nr:hypothetical protein [Lachnospiraceae bacterium]